MDIDERLPGAKAGKAGKTTPFYTFARVVLWIFLSFTFPARFHNKERLNVAPPCLYVPNHLSLLDPILLAMRTPNEIHFLGKDTLRKNPVLRFLLDRLHMIPVARGESDLGAMRACLKALKDGCAVGVFPEGTRKRAGTMESVESGLALLALRTGVPVVPVYFASKPRLFRMTHVYVGAPVPYDDLRREGTNKATCEAMTVRVRNEIYKMRDAARKK